MGDDRKRVDTKIISEKSLVFDNTYGYDDLYASETYLDVVFDDMYDARESAEFSAWYYMKFKFADDFVALPKDLCNDIVKYYSD